MRPPMTLAVVGVDFPNRKGPTRKFELMLCIPGEPVELRPEPRNPADERAIAVFSARGIQIGYLTAERCGWIGAMMTKGVQVKAIFQSATERGGLIRASFDGSIPDLPAVLVPVEHEKPEYD